MSLEGDICCAYKGAMEDLKYQTSISIDHITAFAPWILPNIGIVEPLTGVLMPLHRTIRASIRSSKYQCLPCSLSISVLRSLGCLCQ